MTTARTPVPAARRDPRIDPVAGDVVLAHGRARTIYCAYSGARYGSATESPLASGIVTLALWRRWAKDGEVLHAAHAVSRGSAEAKR